MLENGRIEEEIFDYIDQLKELLSPEIWKNVLLDCSKNEILVMWLLFRKEEVNMSTIADYIHVPLNTATGIVARMEKRGFVIRNRSKEDKRIVTIQMGDKGREQMQMIISEGIYIEQQMISEFTKEEMELFFRVLDKVKRIMSEKRDVAQPKKKIQKIKIE